MWDRSQTVINAPWGSLDFNLHFIPPFLLLFFPHLLPPLYLCLSPPLPPSMRRINMFSICSRAFLLCILISLPWPFNFQSEGDRRTDTQTDGEECGEEDKTSAKGHFGEFFSSLSLHYRWHESCGEQKSWHHIQVFLQPVWTWCFRRKLQQSTAESQTRQLWWSHPQVTAPSALHTTSWEGRPPLWLPHGPLSEQFFLISNGAKPTWPPTID